jgi:hypothetical protein
MLKATTFRHSAKRYAVPQCEFAKDTFFRVGVYVVKRLGPHSVFRARFYDLARSAFNHVKKKAGKRASRPDPIDFARSAYVVPFGINLALDNFAAIAL